MGIDMSVISTPMGTTELLNKYDFWFQMLVTHQNKWSLKTWALPMDCVFRISKTFHLCEEKTSVD